MGQLIDKNGITKVGGKIMERGDILELIEDTAFYKKGKKAHFIGRSNFNPNKIEIVWLVKNRLIKKMET